MSGCLAFLYRNRAGVAFGNWRLRRRLGAQRVIVHPDVSVHVEATATVEGPGRLQLGKAWEGLRHLPSAFKLGRHSRLTVAGGFTIYTGFHLAVADGATFALHGSGYMNNGIVIDCFHAISIGDDVVISKGVTIRDSDNHVIAGNAGATAPVTIGNHVWVGLNATILKGVSLGDGCVIAAGAVVTRDVPAHALAGGVPAVVLREGVEWS
jgi:acetyltransferase-like isoleucine patch superfamily enzyme